MFNDLPFTLIFVICGVVGVVYENSKKIKMIVVDTALLRFYRGIWYPGYCGICMHIFKDFIS